MIAFENNGMLGFDVPGRGFYWHQAGKNDKVFLHKRVGQRSLENKHDDGEVSSYIDFIIILYHIYIYMGVSKNRGSPKWMVKIMENPIKRDDLGVPLFLETSTYIYIHMPRTQMTLVLIEKGVVL